MFLAERDLTQTALAASCDMRDARLSLILTGKATPSLEEALRLEDKTGIPARDFSRVA